jgi:hypothetical protein
MLEERAVNFGGETIPETVYEGSKTSVTSCQIANCCTCSKMCLLILCFNIQDDNFACGSVWL